MLRKKLHVNRLQCCNSHRQDKNIPNQLRFRPARRNPTSHQTQQDRREQNIPYGDVIQFPAPGPLDKYHSFSERAAEVFCVPAYQCHAHPVPNTSRTAITIQRIVLRIVNLL